MNTRVKIVLVLAALVVAATIAALMKGEASQESPTAQAAWGTFLYAIPLILTLFILAAQRWALMGVVIYGTVGLALDLATIVQILTGSPPQQGILAMSAATGLLNFGLIVLAGQVFLQGAPDASPPGSRPPNPPSPS